MKVTVVAPAAGAVADTETSARSLPALSATPEELLTSSLAVVESRPAGLPSCSGTGLPVSVMNAVVPDEFSVMLAFPPLVMTPTDPSASRSVKEALLPSVTGSLNVMATWSPLSTLFVSLPAFDPLVIAATVAVGAVVSAAAGMVTCDAFDAGESSFALLYASTWYE